MAGKPRKKNWVRIIEMVRNEEVNRMPRSLPLAGVPRVIISSTSSYRLSVKFSAVFRPSLKHRRKQIRAAGKPDISAGAIEVSRKVAEKQLPLAHVPLVDVGDHLLVDITEKLVGFQPPVGPLLEFQGRFGPPNHPAFHGHGVDFDVQSRSS